MAYSLSYLSRSEQTANLDKTLNVKAGMDSQPGPQRWSYNALAAAANNSKAQTVAADYFLSAYGYLAVGDSILIATNDGYQEIIITASSSVTVTSSAAWTL